MSSGSEVERLKEIRSALVSTCGLSCRWEAVERIERVYQLVVGGEIPQGRARQAERWVQRWESDGLDGLLTKRTTEERGKAANPIPKLAPARFTEELFRRLARLPLEKKGLGWTDERGKHGHADFTVADKWGKIGLNVKSAGTKFERAKDLVGVAAEDCIPIPSYKAAAASREPSPLLYVILVDWSLQPRLLDTMDGLYTKQEKIVLELLLIYKGHNVREAEDMVTNNFMGRNFEELSKLTPSPGFHVISAAKALAILRDHPERVPGLVHRAWGTLQRAEVNIHISVENETQKWKFVESILLMKGTRGVKGLVETEETRRLPSPAL